jgi:hypothetical protein
LVSPRFTHGAADVTTADEFEAILKRRRGMSKQGKHSKSGSMFNDSTTRAISPGHCSGDIPSAISRPAAGRVPLVGAIRRFFRWDEDQLNR